jgi:osmoprotectant transport system ATP-binding protein
MLALVGVSKSYGPHRALQSTDLTIPAGRTTVLLGPSGSGKSTILRLLVGLVWPDSGQVLFGCTAINRSNVRSLRHRMGYVIQEGGLFPHLTVAGNVTLLARHLDWSPKAIDDRLAALIDLARLPRDVLERYPAQLSGGQRQRVSLMRALMLDPDVLLLDEPLGSLDPMIRHDLQQDLKRIFQDLGKTVVIVTHDIGEAGYFGELLVLLRDGRIVQQGSLQDLVRRPAESFVEQFINAQRSPLETLITQP